MPDLLKAKSSSHKRIAWATGILCVACCAAPFAGLALGSATLAALAGYFEAAAITVAVLGVVLLGYKFASRRKTLACDVNCGCHTTIHKDSESKQD